RFYLSEARGIILPLFVAVRVQLPHQLEARIQVLLRRSVKGLGSLVESLVENLRLQLAVGDHGGAVLLVPVGLGLILVADGARFLVLDVGMARIVDRRGTEREIELNVDPGERGSAVLARFRIF